jgi:putative intracellular protease/amidase
LPTGLWLSELTHFYHLAMENKFEITIASPNGGNTPIDPESLKPILLDKLTKDYSNNDTFGGDRN